MDKNDQQVNNKLTEAAGLDLSASKYRPHIMREHGSRGNNHIVTCKSRKLVGDSSMSREKISH